MLTLSFGFKKPQTGDKGSIVFPALEGNIQQLNDHNHDGANSSQINSSSVLPLTATALTANWVLVADGVYSQTVSLPGALSYDTTGFQVRLPSGDMVVPSINKIGGGSFEIFTNDNTSDLELVYL